ncbi:hypothetical protein [Roseibium sp. SCP14]|uniref:hypothetical protein n=1 Tax=Roseibium sp. SCP14 TaxID=3141375 RepID=UPI00333BEA53
MEDWVQYLNYGAVVFAFLAAIFWFWSAKVPVHKFTGVPWGGNMDELEDAVKRQSVRSAWAAIFAGFAALCQGIALALPNF